MEAFVCLTQLLHNLGFTLNWGKVIPPTQCIVFLGVTIDTLNFTLSIPSDKLVALQSELKDWIHKTKVTKRELQQIIGKLNWAAKLLHATRPFLRRLIDLMCTLKRPSHHVRLTLSVKENLQWLLTASCVFNGTVAIVNEPPLPEFSFASDACETGGAAFFQSDWFYVGWELDFPQYCNVHINLKELFTVLLAVVRWGHLWKNRHITLYTDNQVTMYAINKGCIRNILGMHFIRELFCILAIYNIHISARHISGRDNIIPDALSRLHDEKFAFLAAELLLPFEHYVLFPWYNLTNHMSTKCAHFISQILCPIRRDIWILMFRDIDSRCLQSPRKPLTVHI